MYPGSAGTDTGRRSNNREIIEEKKSGGKIGWKVCWCIWEMEIRSKKMPRFLSGKECWSLSGLRGHRSRIRRSFGGGEGVFIRRRSTDADRDYGK